MRAIYCAALVAVVAGLGGCGINQVRVESAGTVATAGDAVVADAKAILNDARASETKARVTLVASDPKCMPIYPLYIYVPDGQQLPAGVKPADPATVPLCADGSNAGPNYAGFTREPIMLSGPTQDALKPSLDMIAAIAAYDDALATIVASPTTDVTGEFDSALAQAQTAYSDATSAGINLPAVPAAVNLTDSQKSTALALVQMIVDLAHEQDQVDQLKKVFAENSGALGTYCEADVDKDVSPCTTPSGTFAQIADQMVKWSKVTETVSNQITAANLIFAYHSERGKLDFNDRQAFVTTIEAARQDVTEVPKVLFAFQRALAALSAANHDLATALNNPSAAQRAEAAKISQQRVLHALHLVAAAINAWKGI